MRGESLLNDNIFEYDKNNLQAELDLEYPNFKDCKDFEDIFEIKKDISMMLENHNQ